MMESNNGSASNNGKIAFIFPGQGSQAVGMGKDLAEKYPIARQTFEEADQVAREKALNNITSQIQEALDPRRQTEPGVTGESSGG